MTTNDDLLRGLGRVEGMLEAVAERLDRFETDTRRDRELSSESRKRLHERIDEQSERITEAEMTIVAAGATVAQQRDIIAGLTRTIDEDLKPTVEQVKDITRIGKLASVTMMGIGLTFGGVMLWAWDHLRPWLGRWLTKG